MSLPMQLLRTRNLTIVVDRQYEFCVDYNRLFPKFVLNQISFAIYSVQARTLILGLWKKSFPVLCPHNHESITLTN